jgi:hypothetical protein
LQINWQYNGSDKSTQQNNDPRERGGFYMGGKTMYSEELVNIFKKRYPAGTRVKLICTDDPYTRLQNGDCGTVRLVDDMGTIHVNWDCGTRFGLIPTEDIFEVI